MTQKPTVTVDPDQFVLFLDIVHQRKGYKHGVIHEAVKEALRMYIEKYQPKQ